MDKEIHHLTPAQVQKSVEVASAHARYTNIPVARLMIQQVQDEARRGHVSRMHEGAE